MKHNETINKKGRGGRVKEEESLSRGEITGSPQTDPKEEERSHFSDGWPTHPASSSLPQGGSTSKLTHMVVDRFQIPEAVRMRDSASCWPLGEAANGTSPVHKQLITWQPAPLMIK